jgi:hypothetical protein
LFVFRFTLALLEFKLRFNALEPLTDDDQKLPLVPRLLKAGA